MKNNKIKKPNRVVRTFFMTLLISLLACWGATAQTSFGSSSGQQDFIFEEYEFSETTPTENYFNELNNSVLREDDDEWGDGDDIDPGVTGPGSSTGVGVPIGDGMLILLLGGALYGVVLIVRKYRNSAN